MAKTEEHTLPEETLETILRVADMVGGVIEFWGFKRNMGRLWCVLYLQRHPMSAQELAKTLSLSAGTISMTLNELQKWGVIRKVWKPGERREYFEAEESIWKMVSRVFRERELNEIKKSIDLFRDERKRLKAAVAKGATMDEETQFCDQRIKELLELAVIGQKLLDGILSGDSVDSSPLSMFKREPEED